MNLLRTPHSPIRIVPFLLIALACAASPVNPLAHVDVTVARSYEGAQPLPRPKLVVVYDFTVEKSVVQTDKRPGIRARINESRSSEDHATFAAQQVQQQITKDLTAGLRKRLKATAIQVTSGTPDMQVADGTLVIRGVITKLNQGHRLRRGTVGLGAGASDVETDCQISMQGSGSTVLVSELTTVAKSGKKPGAALTVGAGAAPGVAAGVTGATAHKSTAQGDADRTGSALASHIAKLMSAQGWISSANGHTPNATTPTP